jgi:hypothetical protein
MKKNKYPKGWNEERVQKVISLYEHQTDEQAVAEDEAAFGDSNRTVIEVPKELLPAIRQMIAKHQSTRKQ